MLDGVDPLLQRIEALPRLNSYNVTFEVDAGHERSVVTTAGEDGFPTLAAANLPGGWSLETAAVKAALIAVAAFHEARTSVSSGRPQLRDVDGGWDVTIGNVALNSDGEPTCAADGVMAIRGDGVYECAECGAAAIFSAD